MRTGLHHGQSMRGGIFFPGPAPWVAMRCFEDVVEDVVAVTVQSQDLDLDILDSANPTVLPVSFVPCGCDESCFDRLHHLRKSKAKPEEARGSADSL